MNKHMSLETTLFSLHDCFFLQMELEPSVRSIYYLRFEDYPRYLQAVPTEHSKKQTTSLLCMWVKKLQ